MAFTVNEVFNTETFKAASAISGYTAVVLNSVANTVLVASAGSAVRTYGLSVGTQPTAGYNVTVQTGGVGKAIAAASLGIGALVTPGAATFGLVPVGASGVAAASGVIKYAVGIALEAAAAGSIFSVRIQPQQVI
jgi:hypothetical protein